MRTRAASRPTISTALVAVIAAAGITACGATANQSITPGVTLGAVASPSSPTTASIAPTTRPTERPTPTPVLMAPCPSGSPLPVEVYLDTDPACFTGEIEVRGWLSDPPGMGWEGPVVEPQWLYYPPDIRNSALWSVIPAEPDHACPETDPACGWYFLHLAPGSNAELGRKARWVVVTGHVDDPAAATCHYDLQPDDPEGAPTDLETLIQTCRSEFVVDRIRDAT